MNAAAATASELVLATPDDVWNLIVRFTEECNRLGLTGMATIRCFMPGGHIEFCGKSGPWLAAESESRSKP